MQVESSDLRDASIGQISIVVHDLARATACYRDLLGLRLLMEFPGLAFFACGGVRLMLSPPEKPEHDHPPSVLYFRVADLAKTYATLAERGVRFVDSPHLVAKLPDHELWMAFFRDSEENLLALMSEVR
jgi:methylmalonyl-CoA/ethylmalonyl-CoA epimerase